MTNNKTLYTKLVNVIGDTLDELPMTDLARVTKAVVDVVSEEIPEVNNEYIFIGYLLNNKNVVKTVVKEGINPGDTITLDTSDLPTQEQIS